MRTTKLLLTGRTRLCLGVALVVLGVCQTAAPLHAQLEIDWQKQPDFARGFDLNATNADASSAPTVRGNRIRLFRIAPGFLSDPVGLDQDDPTANDPDPQANNNPDWVQLSLGNDNPFFDFRRPGDPGGIGYYKVHSQLQLFDSPKTGCALNLQAMTPSGRDMDGLPDGPTFVIPALSVFHELADGTAVQGYVGKQVQMNANWTNNLNRSIHYGMALQRPLVDANPAGLGNLYWYVGALGRYRFDTDPLTSRVPTWDLMPGVHWQVSENWWLACGFLVPMRQPQADSRLWQLTCSFRF